MKKPLSVIYGKNFSASKSYKYDLDFVKQLSEKASDGQSKTISLIHDDFLHHWRITFELEPQRYWFLSVFISDNGIIETYCLDYEAASDSHYEFKDETSIRKLLGGDIEESSYLHELFIKYVEKNNGFELLKLIRPYITEEFHYD